MNNLYTLMNVSSEKQFNHLLESLDLSADEMVALYDISNNYKSLNEQRQELLDLMAGSSDGNYEIMKNQFKKSNETRRLKEDVNVASNLTLNNVMELNELIELVAKKCQQNKMAAQQVFQMIAKSSSKNVADSFFAMVRNANNTDDNLKFDTELVVDGNKVADVIYGLKNNIVTFLNSVEEPKKQPVKESVNVLKENIDYIENYINNASDKKALNVIIKMIELKMAKAQSTEEKNVLAKLKSMAMTKLNDFVVECNVQDVVSTACEDDTFNGLFKNIGRPTVINITVNKETGDIEEVPFQCEEPTDCVEPNIVNGALQVQNADTCPTALDAPILAKPDKAALVSAMTALNSHMDDIKTDCRENNIECLQTINTLLAQIGDYFNRTLSESVQLDERTGKVEFHTTFETPNGEYYEINGYESGEDEYEVDLLDGDYKHIATSIFNIQGALDDEIKNSLQRSGLNWNEVENKIQSKIAELQEELTEDTVYDHSWYEVDDGEYPERTKDGVMIKESYDSILNDLEDVQQMLYSTNRKSLYVDIINRYLKPYNKSIADLSWTGDFIDIVGEEQAQKAVDELYNINETCSAGATCAGGVAQVSKPFQRKKGKKVSVAESLFLDMILENRNVSQVIDGNIYKLKDGYFYKNDVLVKTKNLNEMIEFVLGNIELPLLEGILPCHLDILLEDTNDMTFSDMAPEQRQLKKEQEQELDNQLQTSVNSKVAIEDDTNTIQQDQELIGVDDSDENNKQYVVKNPANNEVKVVDATKIKIVED